MQYYSNPITEKEKISNALLSFDETEFDKLMDAIHFEWFIKGYGTRMKEGTKKEVADTPLPDSINF